MIADWTDPEDILLARSVFGTDHPGIVEDLILQWMSTQGFGQCVIASIEFSVAAAVTVLLPDSSRMFVKVWPGQTDSGALAAQMRVQAVMVARGYPAPAVLTAVSPLGPGWAVGMAYSRAGSPTDARKPGVRRAMAAGLARFVAEATKACRRLAHLPQRSLPSEGMIWPTPHNALFDFSTTGQGAEWIDRIASSALSVMRLAESRIVVGHHDWSAKNMRIEADEIAVLYDWDAVVLDREAFVLGSAAAQFPVTWELPVPQTPTPEEIAAFVRDYERARGASLTRSELAEIEAGATYARAYTARCEHALDPGGVRWPGSSRDGLRNYGPVRLPR